MMTGPTTPLAPKPVRGLGTGAAAEPKTPRRKRGLVDSLDTIATAMQRGARPDYDAWLSHVAPAAGCAHPVLLRGQITTLDSKTHAPVRATSTDAMPDRVIYKACGNRRATVCPSCAELYRADAYQLVLAGLKGGKDVVPETVVLHPAVFATATAPGFGIVHTQRKTKAGRVLPCRARRVRESCPHGVVLRCQSTPPRRRPAAGAAVVPALLRLPPPRRLEQPGRRTVAAHHRRDRQSAARQGSQAPW